MRVRTPLVRATLVITLAALTLAALVVPRSEARAQDYLAQLSSALGGWGAPYGDFAKKGQEIIDDFTVIFDMAWMAEWQGDLASMDSVAAALGAVTLPSDADADLAALIGEIASGVPGQTEAAQTGMDNIAADSGASLTAAYGALGETDAKVAQAIALVQAAGGEVAPSSTGNAGLAVAGESQAAALAALALFALMLVGGARFATSRVRGRRVS